MADDDGKVRNRFVWAIVLQFLTQGLGVFNSVHNPGSTTAVAMFGFYGALTNKTFVMYHFLVFNFLAALMDFVKLIVYSDTVGDPTQSAQAGALTFTFVFWVFELLCKLVTEFLGFKLKSWYESQSDTTV